MKALILYYSYGGNTKRTPRRSRGKSAGILLSMDTVVPYDGDYDEVVNQGQREIAEGYCLNSRCTLAGEITTPSSWPPLSGGTFAPASVASWSGLT